MTLSVSIHRERMTDNSWTAGGISEGRPSSSDDIPAAEEQPKGFRSGK